MRLGQSGKADYPRLDARHVARQREARFLAERGMGRAPSQDGLDALRVS